MRIRIHHPKYEAAEELFSVSEFSMSQRIGFLWNFSLELELTNFQHPSRGQPTERIP